MKSLYRIARVACALLVAAFCFALAVSCEFVFSHRDSFEVEGSYDGSTASSSEPLRHVRLTGPAHDFPHIEITRDPRTGRTRYSGALLPLFKTLLQKLNLTHTWVSAEGNADVVGGRNETTGEPYGLFSMLAENKTDFLVTLLYLSPGRSSFGRSTYPLEVSSIFLVTSTPPEVPSWKKYADLFDATTWSCLVATSVLVSVFGDPGEDGLYGRVGWGVTLVARILGEQAVLLPTSNVTGGPRRSILRQNLAVWFTALAVLLFSVLTSAVKGLLLTALLSKRYARPISSTDDFRATGLALYLRSDTALVDVARSLNLPFFAPSPEGGIACRMVNDHPDEYGSLFEKVGLLTMVVAGACNHGALLAVPDPVAMGPVVLYFRTDAAVATRHLDAVLQRLVETGLYGKWEADTLSKHRQVGEEVERLLFGSRGKRRRKIEPRPLEVEHVSGPLLCLCVLYASAALVFACEFIFGGQTRTSEPA